MKAHRFDPWSLAGGLVLVSAGLLVLLPDAATLLRLDTFFDLVLPVLALIVGMALVVPALRRRQYESTGLSPDEAQALEELNDSSPPAV